MTDIEIASGYTLKKITTVAKSAGIGEETLELYGSYKAKLNVDYNNMPQKGKLILVTAINPTPMGEGKTTVSIGLADGLRRAGKNAGLALREPSLGPVFGVKGGATGGGHAQVAPMEDINLHFTGDLAAITSANNLLSAVIDNHIFQGNSLRINPESIIWHRCMDLNDRSLRFVGVGQGGEKDGFPRKDSFDITAASEVMAILCLAKDLEDLKVKLGNITVGYNYGGEPVYCRDLKADNAMAILLKDALKPNLVQTLEGTPAIIHGGPFANIAHGCNSLIATKTALSLFDYAVTEAGFGADLGAEKFLDIKCRIANLKVAAVVIVATIRALKYCGGAAKDDVQKENRTALVKGMGNLEKHIENITQNFKLPCVVAVNRYVTDTDAEIELVSRICREMGADAVPVTVWAEGGKGAETLAQKVIKLCEGGGKAVNYTYSLTDPIESKISGIVTKIYGGSTVSYSDAAKSAIADINKSGYSDLPVVIAKTQYSLSADPALVGRPQGFDFYIKEVYLRSGAGFIVAVAGSVMLMPGLPKIPASDNMKITAAESGYKIEGLF